MLNKSAAQIKLQLLHKDWWTIQERDDLSNSEMLSLYPDLAERINRTKKEVNLGQRLVVDFEIISGVESLIADLIDLQEIINLLAFWEQYPEIKSITLFGEEESIDDETYVTPRVTDIQFVKETGLTDLLSRFDWLEEYQEISDFDTILFDDGDLMVQLMTDKEATYVRPANIKQDYFQVQVTLVNRLSELLSETATRIKPC